MFSKNDPRPQYNAKILVEQYENENKRIVIYENFTPNPRSIALSSKFYSAHETVDPTTVDAELINIITDYKDKRPDQKYSKPILESHQIGWHNKPFVPLMKTDSRFYHPKKKSITLSIPSVKGKFI